jgi:hypothetical protein
MRILVRSILIVLFIVILAEIAFFIYIKYFDHSTDIIKSLSEQNITPTSSTLPKSIFEPDADCTKNVELCNYLLTQEKRHKQYVESKILVSSSLTEKLTGTISVIEKKPGQWESVNDIFQSSVVNYAKRIIIESPNKQTTYTQVFPEDVLNILTVEKMENDITSPMNFDDLAVGDKIEIINTLDGLSHGLFQTLRSIQIIKLVE